MISSDIVAVSASANPAANITSSPPARIASFNGVRITNYTPFTWTLSGVFNDQATEPVLSPYTVMVFPYDNVRGSITLRANTIPGSPSLPDTMQVTFEYSDSAQHDLGGAYPAPIPGQGFTNISGPVSISGDVTIDGDVDIGTVNSNVSTVQAGVLYDTFNDTGASTVTFQVQEGYPIIAFGFRALINTNLAAGGTVVITGTFTGFEYYRAVLPSAFLTDFCTAIPNIETDMTVTITIDGSVNWTMWVAGQQSGSHVQWSPGSLIINQPFIYSGIPSFTSIAGGVTRTTLVADPGAGVQIVVTAIQVTADIGAATKGVTIEFAYAGPTYSTIWNSVMHDGETKSLTFPQGMVLDTTVNGSIVASTGAGAGNTQVTIYYSYRTVTEPINWVNQF